MSQGIFIIGTDTEVGKTVVSAGLMSLFLRKKYNAAYYKPIASGEVEMGGVSGSADAWFVKMVSGFNEDEHRITPFAFKNAVAPHLAARWEGKPIDIQIIKETLQYLTGRYEWIVAEGAGGLAVPLNDNGMMQYDLIRELGFDCFLVARPGLGTINHTLLTIRCAESLGIRIKGLFINGYADSALERDNITTIKNLIDIPAVFTVPSVHGVHTERLRAGNLREVFEKTINIEEIARLMRGI